MQPQVNETQPNNPQDGINLTNDELAAAMGYMTTLGDQNMQSQMTQENPEEPTEPTEQQIDPEQIKTDVMKDVKKLLKEEMGGIKEILKEALKEDEKESD